MIPIPRNDSRGRSNKVEVSKIIDAVTKSTGTAGYPTVKYGRGRLGFFILSTITDAAVIAYRIQLAKMTKLKMSSYLPERTRRQDHSESARTAFAGVWCRGWTRLSALKK